MKKSIGLAIVTLIFGSFIGIGLFYVMPYSNLHSKYQNLKEDNLETRNELIETREEITRISDELDLLRVEFDTLRRDYESIELDYLSLSTDHSQLDNDYLKLKNEYSELKKMLARAEYEPIPPFTVRGKFIYDKFGRRVSLKGFALDSGRFAPGFRPGVDPFVKEDMQRIKDWGFHFVYSQLWWVWVEHDQNQTGVYDFQNMLDRYHHVIDWCDEVNLNWIFRFRVSYEDDLSGPDAWWGWCTAGYVCTEEGLERYCNFLKDIISIMESKHDNIVAYQPWQFPFHRTQYSEEQKEFYHNRVIPEMINAVRNVTDKPIVISPLHAHYVNFNEMIKVDDSNVLYSFCYYHPVNHHPLTSEDQRIWEGTSSDIEEQWDLLKPAIDFSNKYDVPLNILEFGITMERQDQLDKLRLKLKVLDYHNIGWCYWWYSWWEEDFISFNVFYPDGTPKQGLVDLLIENNDWLY